MNHAGSNAYAGLLPNDVAGVQAIYGAAAGSNPDDYRPVDVSSFQVLPGSEVSVWVYATGLFDLAQTSDFWARSMPA